MDALAVLMGAAAIAGLAQISIPLPYSPVPLTGQTFGVSLIALLLGSRHSLAAVAVYLIAGSAGLPVFAAGRAGFSLGPTSGYLIGMLGAAWVTGRFADAGWGSTFLKATAAGLIGSLCFFVAGVVGLAFFIPAGDLFAQGVLPFLPGDLIKSAAAGLIASRASRRRPE
jgi:biotin transport system substrate-specific component